MATCIGKSKEAQETENLESHFLNKSRCFVTCLEAQQRYFHIAPFLQR